MRLAGSLILLAIALTSTAWAGGTVERCQGQAQEVRRAHAYYFGVDFPSEYAVGQRQQESNCRDVLSRDGVGSEGPAQITFRLWKEPLRKQGITEIRTAANHAKAQAFINRSAYREAAAKKLWVMFQIYNGGGLVNREIARAGKADWQAARQQCRRKIVHFQDGSSESACDINYDYSKRIYRYGEQYRVLGPSSSYPYW